MAPRAHRLASPPALALLLACAALAGCGGGGGGSTAQATTEAHSASTATTTSAAKRAKRPDKSGGSGTGSAAAEPGPPASAFAPRPHHDSGGGSAQFEVKGADNSVQEFGSEASESELEEAAAALHAFLDARAARNWAAACNYLDQATKQGFAQLSAATERPQSCAATLAALSGKVPTSTLREGAEADVGSLREEGGQAFLIYRGAAKTIFAISMAKEDGTWQVASLAGTPLN